jgi:hypothetical protein
MKTIEWVEDFEEADFGGNEVDTGESLAAVFRKGDRTDAEIEPGSDEQHVTLFAQGLPDALTVPRSAFRIVND